MDTSIEEIRIKLKKIKQEEYDKVGHKIDENIEVSIPVGQKASDMDVRTLNASINKLVKKKEYKRRITDTNDTKKEVKNKDKYSTEMFDINAFNTIDDKECIDWKKINKEEKLEILEDFINGNNKYQKNIENDIASQLREMLDNGQLSNKKDIIFDQVNRNILDIPRLKLNENNEFSITFQEKKIKPKRKINTFLKK